MNNKNKKNVVLLLTFLFTAGAHAQSVVKNKSQGRKPSSEVKMRASGVPSFEMVQKKGKQTVRVKDIPKLDIGEERQIQATITDLKLPAPLKLKNITVDAKKSPALVNLPPDLKLIPVSKALKYVKDNALAQVPSVKSPGLVPEPILETPETKLQNMVEIKPDEYKMLQALIFLEYHKKYELAMSLFVELMDIKEYRQQALYHYAHTAYNLGLFSEFRHKMLQASQETKDQVIKKHVAESLARNVASLEVADIAVIDPLVEAFDIDVTKNEAYLMKRAKHFSDKGDLAKVEDALVFIPTTSPHYAEASLLKAIFNYRIGKVDQAISELELSWPEIENRKKDQVRNLSALTLGRLYFQKGEYKNAYKMFTKVDKSSSSWLQAMVETAWAQILAGDHEGAAGNMFSLHTDFFRKAYAPDTYIVRTVGYLNLCQYGDGMNVLNDLKKRYGSAQQSLVGFQSKNKDPQNYYDLVKALFHNSSAEQVDGLPRAFVVELARHPNFTALQKQINNHEDENTKFNQLTIDLIRKERETRLQMLETKNEFASATRNKSSASTLQRKEQMYLAAGVEHTIISRAREGIKKMRSAAVDRLEKEKEALRLKAAKNLQSRFNTLTASLANLVDQNEVLSYEIYSGAGEHIRFQMAGGDVKERNTASLAPGDKESYKWKHKGEVWEDELGHYRSSLKNVCQPDDLAQNK